VSVTLHFVSGPNASRLTISASRLRQPSGFKFPPSGLSAQVSHRPRHASIPKPPARGRAGYISDPVGGTPPSRNDRLSAPSAFRFQVSVLRSSVFQCLFHPPPGGCPIGRSSHKLRSQCSSLPPPPSRNALSSGFSLQLSGLKSPIRPPSPAPSFPKLHHECPCLMSSHEHFR